MTARHRVALLTTLPLWAAIYFHLEEIADTIVQSLLRLDPHTRFATALAFFLFETPKVLLLLILIVFIVGIVRSYLPPERTRAMLAGKPLFAGNVLASCLGIVTPFCSCSAVPLFIGFVETGIPIGVTMSFLIAAPMINEVALVLLFGLFGWQIALLYVGTGLAIATTTGFLLGKLRVERFVEPWVFEIRSGAGTAIDPAPSWDYRLLKGEAMVREIAGKVWPFVVIGIAAGAGIHGYVPEDYLASVMGRSAWWSVPLSVLIGIPLYANAAGIVPVVQALLAKGASLGTALAFMMSVIGLSFPEMIILRKVLRLPLIVIFAAVLAAGITLTGYLFNIVL